MQRKTATADPMGMPGTFTDDDPDGTVWAIAAVTGVRDDVGDVIEPGAFRRSLRVRTPKGVLGHDWSRMVARADQVIELMPGDARLPTTLADGTPWPSSAGALLVRGRFNLSTRDGQEAYSNARFYGDSMGYSIGYKVAKSQTRGGVRYIADLDLFEFSPVLHGANRHARLLAVKTARPAGLETKATPLAAPVRRTIYAVFCGTCKVGKMRTDRPVLDDQPFECEHCARERALDDPWGDETGEGRAVLTAADLRDLDELGRITSEDAYAEAQDEEAEYEPDASGDLRPAPDDRRWKP